MDKLTYLIKIEDSQDKAKVIAYLDYAHSLKQSDPKASIEQSKLALKLAYLLEDFELVTSSQISIVNACFYLADLKKAEHWINQLLRTGLKHKILNVIGAAYNMKSRLAFQANNLNLALKNILKALDYYLQSDEKPNLMSCYNALGLIHYNRNETDEALHYLNLALKIAEEIESNARFSIGLNLSNLLFEQNKFEEALKNNLKYLEFFRNNNMVSNESTALYNIGKAYHHLKEYNKSLEYFKQALSLYRKNNNLNYLEKTYESIAILLIEMGKANEALQYIESAEKLANDNNNNLSLKRLYEIYSQYYEACDDFDKANDFLRKQIELIELIDKESNQKQITEMETKYKTQIYQIKTSELDIENQAANQQLIKLEASLELLRETHQNLNENFQNVVSKMNTQGDLLSSQSRMAVMGEMVSSIAHQWRQPLNIVGILAQSIGDARDYDELNDEFLAKQLKHISGQVDYMNETINDFRNFFKPDFITDFCVKEVIEKSISLVAFMMKRESVTIETNLESVCKLSGNPNELIQVIINILNNAREAMVSDDIPDKKIVINLSCHSKIICIKIINTGNALPAELKTKIFEPYYTTKGDHGTGIGLHICRMIIEDKFNGKINTIDYSDGVQFIIEIPQ